MRAGGKSSSGGGKSTDGGFDGVRLNKLLAHTGAAPSRRAAEAMIGEGRVVVNGAVVTDVGHKVDPNADRVAVDGKAVATTTRPSKDSVWVKVHKPKGAVAALSDARGRKCLGDLVPDARERGLLPVGRLGREAAGLLLLTDDREGAHLLASKAAGLVRVYKMVVEKGMPAPQALAALAKGMELEVGAGEDEDEEEEGPGRRRGGRGGGGGGRQPRPQQGQGQGQRWKETLAPMTVQCVDYFADRKEAVLEVRLGLGLGLGCLCMVPIRTGITPSHLTSPHPDKYTKPITGAGPGGARPAPAAGLCAAGPPRQERGAPRLRPHRAGDAACGGVAARVARRGGAAPGDAGGVPAQGRKEGAAGRGEGEGEQGREGGWEGRTGGGGGRR